MEALGIWLEPTIDLALVALLALVVWRLGADPARRWRACEARLGAMLVELRGLVGEAEHTARELDRGLAARAARLEALLADGAARPARAEAGVDEAVATLAAEGLGAEDIARRLDLPPAEVRVRLGVQAVRAAAARLAGGKNGAAETAARG